MKSQLTIEKRGQCHNYSIFIASRYFENIQDFFNLEIAVKRFRGNLEKFHYNPISLTNKTMKYFPNVETLHLYDEKDQMLEGGRIGWYCIWYRVNCRRAREIRDEIGEENEGEIIEFKDMIYTNEDAKDEYEKINGEMREIEERSKDQKADKETKHIEYKIPEGVKEISDVEFKNAKDITFPKSVTRIGNMTVTEHQMTTLRFPANVKEIGIISMSYNRNGIYVEIPKSVTRIEKDALRNIKKLIELRNFANVSELRDKEYRSFTDLSRIELPTTITSIGESCFSWCFSLTGLMIPTTVKRIGKKAFESCVSLTYLHIPTSVEEIGIHCFNDCESLTSLDMPIRENKLIHGNHIYLIVNGVMNSYMNYDTLRYLNGEEVEYNREITIPTNVTRIGECCFETNTQLEKITIPTTVIEIGNNCFESCESMKSITIPSSVISIGNNCFESCQSLTSITIPTSVTKIGDECFSWCQSLSNICIPTSISSIGKSCFCECSSLTSITIPMSVTEIGDECFSWCHSLSNISIPTSISSIGKSCFYQCSSLTSITIPTSVTEIGKYCFERCTSLISITIPTSVTEISEECFEECSSVLSIEIPMGVKTIPFRCFSKCTTLTSITIPTSVTSFEDNCFCECSSITSIIIPTSVTEIGDGCFDGCKSMKTIYLPRAFEEIFNEDDYIVFY